MKFAKILVVFSLSTAIVLSNTAFADPSDLAPKGPYEAELIGEKILNPVLFGVNAGLPVADASGVQLSNGKIRAYVFAQNKGIEIADSEDGKTFTRVGNAFGGDKGFGMPHVVKLADGRFRMYNMVSQGISCSISTDGLTFTLEKQTCINKADFPAATNGLTGPSIVKLKDGSYRAYFSDAVMAGTGPDPHFIMSATSSDGLTWKADSGVRIGPNASTITRSGEHPGAIAHEDGTVTLFYYDNCAKAPKDSFGKWSCDPQAQGLWYATSSDDGLTFKSENRISFPTSIGHGFGNDANVFMDKNGKLILWGGGFENGYGGYISAFFLTKKIVSSPTPTPTPTQSQTPTPPKSPTPSEPNSQPPYPIASSSVSPKTVAKAITITCIKGKLIKKVTAINPKCPSGYKKK